ncbi:MAG: nuclear transport factor 2 family protein [bacterium]
MKKLAILIVLALLTGSVFMTSCKQTKNEPAYQSAVADTINALMAGIIGYSEQVNADSALNLLSDDSAALFISDRMYFSKTGIKSAMKNIYSQIKTQNIEMIHSQVLVPAPGFAVWIGYGKDGYITKEDRAISTFLCETWIWERKPEGWKVVHSHESILNLPDPEQQALVEAAVDKLAKEIAAKPLPPAGMFPVLKEFLKKYPSIYGAAMAFAPTEADGKKQLASPYIYRKKTEFVEVNLESAYDYTTDEWYAEPVRQGKPFWSNPYYDDGGGGVVMVTYSVPVFNTENKLIGVVTSDLTLE